MATHAAHDSTHGDHGHDAHGSVFKRVIVPFLILLGITVVEFIFALGIKNENNATAIKIFFVVLTLAKAFYIVADFMHLRYEKKGLKLSIVLPLLFIIYLLVLMVVEAEAIYAAIFG